MKKISTIVMLILGTVVVSFVFTGCEKLYNLPVEKEYISNKISYSSKVFEPILGRTTLFGIPNTDNSTLPLTFEIINARYGDGTAVTDLFQTKPTYVWISEYDGLETSLTEIEAKRKIEERPLFEIRTSGQFIMWASSSNELINPRPVDTSNYIQDIRFFDLKITNSGGDVIIKDFQIKPWRERPYSPINDMNPYSGGIAPDPQDPKNPSKRDYLIPSRLTNVIGELTDKNLVSNSLTKDVVIYIRPFEGGVGNSLRFKFLDKNEKPISPKKFNETRWETLVHGFNMKITDEYVQYDVAYPIPLVNVSTAFSNGSTANVNFSYSRIKGLSVTTANLGLDFAIYRPGDWEVVFHFRNDNPNFNNE